MPKLMSRRLFVICVLVPAVAACTRTNPPISQAQLPLGSNTPVAAPQQNDQVLRVTIQDGKFDSTIYSEQSGATQMLIISMGGPYLFEVDKLVDRRELPADGSMVVNYDTSAAGDFAIRAYQSTSDGTSKVSDTAVLRITPVGE